MTFAESPAPAPPRWDAGAAAALGLSVVASVAFAVVAWQRAYFRGDDYVAFHGVVTKSLSNFLLTPVDVHFIPLHKLASWSIYRLAPLDFAPALGVMCAFHLLGVWMLYRTLALLGAGRLAAPLAALCGTNVYFGVLLVNWSAGIARFPYVLLSIAAVYHYVRFRESGSWGRIAVIGACVVGASAFFSKGLLIPGYLAAVELALLPGTSRRGFGRRLAGIATVAGVAVIYRLVGLPFISTPLRTPPIHWNDQLVSFELFATILHQGLFGLYPDRPFAAGNWLVVGLSVALVAVSVARDRYNVIVWLLALGVVVANLLVITLSPRMLLGPVIVLAERYYFDVMFLVVLFAAIAIRRTMGSAASGTPYPGRVATGTAWLVVVASSWVGWHTFLRVLSGPLYAGLPEVRAYANMLRTGLAEIRRTRADTLEFAQGGVPSAVLGMAGLHVGRLSEFLPIFDRDVRVGPHGRCSYVVRPDGMIIRPPADCVT
jgi:hypothetical protein